MTNSSCKLCFGPCTKKFHSSSRWLKKYCQSCITRCTIWDCLTSWIHNLFIQLPVVIESLCCPSHLSLSHNASFDNVFQRCRIFTWNVIFYSLFLQFLFPWYVWSFSSHISVRYAWKDNTSASTIETCLVKSTIK